MGGISRAALTALAVALLAALFCFVRLGAVPFDDPGEGMHAEIARELLGSSDPFRLTLNGVVYVDKPPLPYALQAAVFTIFGTSETAARAVSAGAAVAAVMATAWLGATLLGPGAGASSPRSRGGLRSCSSGSRTADDR
ncbi:MAG: hypothetical protein AUH30_00825 [Candidatus Rokubacteria bacterium 13_1_40CM_68_15]|nr:MAG: hypothetical protein AUH30_00825 [Candidatus Rokubacteria bacterium 13_1_40CM_68_15]